MFILAVMGNVTYSLGIFLYSVEKNFLIAKLPWLVGSIGTLCFDFTVSSWCVCVFYRWPHDQVENHMTVTWLITLTTYRYSLNSSSIRGYVVNVAMQKVKVKKDQTKNENHFFPRQATVTSTCLATARKVAFNLLLSRTEATRTRQTKDISYRNNVVILEMIENPNTFLNLLVLLLWKSCIDKTSLKLKLSQIVPLSISLYLLFQPVGMT